MKVLLIADSEYFGGTGTFLKRIIEFLENQKNNFSVYLNHLDKIKSQDYSSFHDYIKNYKLDYFLFRVFRKFKLHDLYCYFRDKIILSKIIKNENPDLCIISQGGGLSYYPILSKNIPTLFFCHSMHGATKQFIKKIIQFDIKKTRFEECKNKRIILVSNFAKNEFIKNATFIAPNIQNLIIPNYGQQITISKNNDTKNISILTMGLFTTFKNVEVWFEVAKIITKKYSNVHFYWAGTGDLLKTYEPLIKKIKNIHLLGFVSPQNAYKYCDIYFHPSKIETQGIAVIDAMAIGAPCVASNVGGIPESIQDGYNGYFHDSNDTISFVASLSTLIENKKQRHIFGENSIKIYKEKFSKESWTSSVLAAINEIKKV